MKIVKKTLSLFLSLVMLLSLMAGIDLSAYAQTYSGKCGDNVTYTLDTGTGLLTISGSGMMTDYSSTSNIPWYNQRTSVKTVDIKSGVTSIGDYAFEYCRSLTSVTIGNSVTSIGYWAFGDCTSLTSITIPDSVTSIGDYAFRYCTSLTSITIPDSVTSIGDDAFRYCASLTNINVNADNNYYSSQDGVLFNKSKTELIQYPIGNARTSYTIPSSVTSIGYCAFGDCTSLTSIIIGNSVTSIGDSAFGDCTSLTSIIIGNSVTSIGDYAFSDCTSLISITIPDSVTSIGYHAFCYCASLTNINVNADNNYYSSQDGVLFNKSKTELIQYPIGNARTSYTIPNSVTSIGSYAFFYCDSLTSVTILDSVTSIGYSAFYVCNNLKNIYYNGSQSQWNNISIGSNNECLTNATIHYNHVHSYKCTETIEPTCTENGSKTYTCTECGSLIVETIEKLSHNPGKEHVEYNDDKYPYIQPTCRENGSYWFTTRCETCGEVLYARQVILPAIGDEFEPKEIITYKEGTEDYCTKNDTITYECSRCGETYTEVTRKAAGHNYDTDGDGEDDYVVTTQPTCTEKGIETATCQKCGHQKNREIESIGHYVQIDTNESLKYAPTCTEEGYVCYACARCGELIRKEAVPALGHSWNNGTVTKNATCTADGVRTFTCRSCSAQKTETIKKTGHTYNSRTTAPTCTQGGYTTHTCTQCGDSYVSDYTSATGHSWNNGTITKNATCTADGVKTYTCTVCGEKYTETIPKFGHNYQTIVTSPTCTQGGYTTHTCTRCGDAYTDSNTQAKGHNWNSGTVTKSATCTADGVRTFTCRSCSAQKTETIKKTGHTYNTRTTTPTCTQEGYTTYTCRYCNNTYKDNITPAKGHSWDNGAVTKDATYMYNGEKTFTCTACGEKYIEIIPKTGNAYKVILSKTSYLYDGKVKTPKVTVKDGSGQKLSANQYTVSYPKGRKQIGQYIITVKIKSSGASIKTAFTIKPKKTSFKSVKSTKKGVVEATWSKVSGISGYNIQYKSNSQRGWKSGNVLKSKTGAVIKKAKSGAKVSIRVRTYKTVKVNGKSQKIYSDWSKTKMVKVK